MLKHTEIEHETMQSKLKKLYIVDTAYDLQIKYYKHQRKQFACIHTHTQRKRERHTHTHTAEHKNAKP